MLQQLSLLLGGTLLAIIIDLWFRPLATKRRLVQVLLLLSCLFFLLSGFGIISEACRAFNLSYRRVDKKIGILNVGGWSSNNDQICSYTNISPEDWKKAIEEYAKANKVKIKLKLITANDNFDSYTAILNPYGGVYPEKNLAQSTTLNKIFDYVSQGGLFINVSDVPGYWAYNHLLHRKLDATPQIYGTFLDPNGQLTLSSVRPFELTPFMEKLGIRVLKSDSVPFENWQFKDKSNESLGSLKVNAGRVAIVEKNVDSILLPQKIHKKDVTPLFYTTYGNGKFLLSLMWPDLEKQPDTQFQNLLLGLIFKDLNGKN